MLPATMPNGQPWPRVSIVTPSYNQALFIEETIRSVLLQGYPDLEYIILDGNSTDRSVEIIRKYEPWLAYWVSKRDRGQTQAINKGVKSATGQIVAYINSDDTYLCGAIQAVVAAFDAQPGTGMVYGSAEIVDEGSRPIGVWKAYPFDLGTLLATTRSLPQPAVFFSGIALKEVGYFDEQWQLIMDYQSFVRVGMHFPAVCLSRNASNVSRPRAPQIVCRA